MDKHHTRRQRWKSLFDKCREGEAAPGLRHAFLPAIVSTSGRIHGELLWLLFIIADKKTTLSFRAMVEAVDVGLLLAPEWGLLALAGFPWAGVRASRYPVHPGRRPTSPPATSGAPPWLSTTTFWLWALLCASTGCSLPFSFLFLCSFCLCV